MADRSVAHFLPYAHSHNKLAEVLMKLDALANVTMMQDFLRLDPAIIHDYLWAVSDFTCQAKALNEAILDSLWPCS